MQSNKLSRRGFCRSVGALGAAALVDGLSPPEAGAAVEPAPILQSNTVEPAPILQSNRGVGDWPEFRGRGRLGVWTESGILEKFPEKGLTAVWRTPVRAGYAGPAVAGGRVFVVDYEASARRLRGVERIQALDQTTGRVMWSRNWETNYQGMLDTWAIGPAATPTVDGDRVYVLGRAGALFCLKVQTGEIVWQKDYMKDYGAEIPNWGFTGAPLVDGDRLICLVGGTKAKVVTFDKTTGAERWSALPSNSEPGYAQLLIINAGGTRQLIAWHPVALTSLDPATGRVYWEQPFKIDFGMTVPTAVQSGSRLLVTCFYNGSLMMSLDARRPSATVLWKGTSNSEVQTDGLHSVVATPVIDGDYVYGLCSYGQLRCLNAATGERIWESQAVTKERARWASGQIVRQGDRYFINNDRGDLIIARLTPRGYEEVSRTALIKPTTPPGNRRALEVVNWSHPAYANRCIYARNDEEILCASLAAQ